MLTGTAIPIPIPFAPAARGSLSDVIRRESFSATHLDQTRPAVSWLRPNLFSYSRENINAFIDSILGKLIFNLEQGTSPVLFNINLRQELLYANVTNYKERMALLNYALRIIHPHDIPTLSTIITFRTFQAALNQARHKFYILHEHNVPRTANFTSEAEFTALFAILNRWLLDLSEGRKTMLNKMIEEKLMLYQNTQNEMKRSIAGVLSDSNLSADISAYSSMRDTVSSSRKESGEFSESEHPFGVPESEVPVELESEGQEWVPLRTIPTTILTTALREYASSDLDIATTTTGISSQEDKSDITSPFSPLSSFTEEEEPGMPDFKNAEVAAVDALLEKSPVTPDKFELLFRVIINAIPLLNSTTNGTLRNLANGSYENSTGDEKIRFFISVCQNYKAPAIPKASFFACCSSKGQSKSKADKFIELIAGLKLDQITGNTESDVRQLLNAIIGKQAEPAANHEGSSFQIAGSSLPRSKTERPRR